MAKEPAVIVRIHLAENTHEAVFTTTAGARNNAEQAVTKGVWVGNRLYPPSAIVYVELIRK